MDRRELAHTPIPGVNIPAVTIRFEKTKHDMRKGRKTGSPVSVAFLHCYSSTIHLLVLIFSVTVAQ